MRFGFYNSKVCKSGSGVQEYRVVVKSIIRTTEFTEVVITVEKLMDFVVEKTCLARHSKKSCFLIVRLLKK